MSDPQARTQPDPDEPELTPEDEEEIERRASEIGENRRAGKLLPWEALFPPQTTRQAG